MTSCPNCGAMVPDFSLGKTHACPPRQGILQSQFPPNWLSPLMNQKPMPTDQDLRDAVRAERERCMRILESEAKRGKDILALLPEQGWANVIQMYDKKSLQVGIEVIEYLIGLISDPTNGKPVG